MIALAFGVVLIYILIDDDTSIIVDLLFVVDDPGSVLPAGFVYKLARGVLQRLLDPFYVLVTDCQRNDITVSVLNSFRPYSSA